MQEWQKHSRRAPCFRPRHKSIFTGLLRQPATLAKPRRAAHTAGRADRPSREVRASPILPGTLSDVSDAVPLVEAVTASSPSLAGLGWSEFFGDQLEPGDADLIPTRIAMRTLQVSDVAYGIDTLFAEITELAPLCKFRDCTHMHEPGCAVQAASKAGTLDPERLARWRKLSDENQNNTPVQTGPRGAKSPAGRGKRR